MTRLSRTASQAPPAPQTAKAIARQMGPQALRMNLNTLVRHEVFILNVGGFSDAVFSAMSSFLSLGAGRIVAEFDKSSATAEAVGAAMTRSYEREQAA